MSTSEGKEDASVPRHEEINKTIINHLESAVTKLEAFVSELKGGDLDEVPILTTTGISLFDFLTGAAANINERTNRINGAVSELREILL